HGGGVDNIFPHHEAEIAQTEGCTGEKFVRYWLHCAHLMVEGQKMAKSLGNFYTLRDVLAKGYSGREVRYALMRVHYRAPLNFTWEGMEEARVALARVDDWVRRLGEKAGEEENVQRPTSNAQRPMEEFDAALDDDLNISGPPGIAYESGFLERRLAAAAADLEHPNARLKIRAGKQGFLHRLHHPVRMLRRSDPAVAAHTVPKGDLRLVPAGRAFHIANSIIA